MTTPRSDAAGDEALIPGTASFPNDDPPSPGADGSPGTSGSPGADGSPAATSSAVGTPTAEGPSLAAGAAVRRPVFTIEGRAAPGLYFAGWLCSVIGLAVLFVAFAAAGGGPLTFLLAIGGLASTSLGLVAAAGAQAIQRRADGLTGYDGPTPVLVFGAALATSILVSGIVSVTGVLRSESPATLVLSLLITTAVNLGLVRLLVVGPRALSWAEMGVCRPARGTLSGDVAWGVSLGVGALLATSVIAAILVALLGATPPSVVPLARSPLDAVLNFIAAAVVAPIGEELFYRGFATTAWLRRIGPSRAIVRGAVFFAIVHVLTLGGATFSEAVRIAAIAFVARLPIAYLLGWIFVRRSSLWASIALHATYNGVALLLAELAGRSATGG